MTKAIVCPIPFGDFEIEGLMLPDGTFAIAVTQIAILFETSTNTASRNFKRLLGEDFKTSKYKTEFNIKPVNVVTLDVFSQIMEELAFSGNDPAKNLMRLLRGLSLHQLWCDAFGIRFEKEERQK